MLTFEELQYIWKPIVTQGKYQFSVDVLVEVLVKLEFAYRLQSLHGILVPHLLPSSRPSLSYIWPCVAPNGFLEWGRTLIFPFLPIGFFGRVATRLLHLPTLQRLELWQSGLLFKVKSVDSISELILLEFVESANSKTSLIIRIRTNNKTNNSTLAFSRVIDSIDNLLEAFFPKLGTVTRRLIPCTHCLRQEAAITDLYHFSQEKCVAMLLAGEQFVYCNGMATRPIPLLELIPDLSLDSTPWVALSDIVKLKEIGHGAFGVV